MLVNLFIQNFRSIRGGSISFAADRPDMSLTKEHRNERYTELRLLYPDAPENINSERKSLVPVKNIIGLSSFGKSSVYEALHTLCKLSSGDHELKDLYHPCLEEPKLKGSPCVLGAVFDLGITPFTKGDNKPKLQRFVVEYHVSFNAKEILHEIFSVRGKDEWGYEIQNGEFKRYPTEADSINGVTPQELLTICQKAYQECLAHEDGENSVQKRPFLSEFCTYHGSILPYELFSEITERMFFLNKQDLNAKSIIALLNKNLQDELSMREKKSNKALDVLFFNLVSEILKDLSSVVSVHSEYTESGYINKIVCRHESTVEGEFFELDLNDESDSIIAEIGITICEFLALKVGGIAIIDDFNAYLPPFSQIYLPKLFKRSEYNLYNSQLIIVHRGEKVMIPDGKDCADEVCCLQRDNKLGTLLLSGKLLLKSNAVKFADTPHPVKMLKKTLATSTEDESPEKITAVADHPKHKAKRNRDNAPQKSSDGSFYFEIPEDC